MDDKCPQGIEKYIELILREKKVRNIIGTSNPEEIFEKHIRGCLGLSKIISGKKGIDVGSGNGLPGLVVAIDRKEKNITVLDSSASKVNFLTMVKRRCGLDNVDVLRGRAEKLAHLRQYREKYNFALSRALAPLKISAEICLPFIKKGGHYYIMSGKGSCDEAAGAQEIIESAGGAVEKITSEGVIVIKKVSSTPEKIPRKWKKIR